MAVFPKILVPFDTSKNAFNALDKAVAIAKESPDIELEILYVAVIPKSSLQGNYATYAYSAESQFSDVNSIIQAATNELQNEYEDIKALIADHIDGVDGRVKLTLIPGMSPVDDIVEYAEKIRCDLIVMGSRGLGAIRGIMGSVSTGVLRYASMPVLIVK